MDTQTLLETIKQAAYEVRRHLGPGFLEIVYKKALAIELRSRGLDVRMEVPVTVLYKGHVVGEYYADIIVEGRVIIEAKAVRELTVAHELQLVNYLVATGIDDGMLVNYGGERYRVMCKTRLYPRGKTAAQ